jgi:hypothetical protein
VKKLFVLLALLGASLMAAEKTVFDFTLNSIDGQPALFPPIKERSFCLSTSPAVVATRPNTPDWNPSTKNTKTVVS